jgi:hypothetical protein
VVESEVPIDDKQAMPDLSYKMLIIQKLEFCNVCFKALADDLNWDNTFHPEEVSDYKISIQDLYSTVRDHIISYTDKRSLSDDDKVVMKYLERLHFYNQDFNIEALKRFHSFLSGMCFRMKITDLFLSEDNRYSGLSKPREVWKK